MLTLGRSLDHVQCVSVLDAWSRSAKNPEADLTVERDGLIVLQDFALIEQSLRTLRNSRLFSNGTLEFGNGPLRSMHQRNVHTHNRIVDLNLLTLTGISKGRTLASRVLMEMEITTPLASMNLGFDFNFLVVLPLNFLFSDGRTQFAEMIIFHVFCLGDRASMRDRVKEVSGC